MRRAGFHNTEPTEDFPTGAPSEAAKIEFAKRLQQAMVEKGWNQSELASRAAKFTSDGKFGRYSVSCYIRAMTLPRPEQLDALCKALGKQPADLLPTRGVPTADERIPPLDIRDVGEGQAWLRVNQSVSWQVALDVMKLIKANGDHA